METTRILHSTIWQYITDADFESWWKETHWRNGYPRKSTFGIIKNLKIGELLWLAYQHPSSPDVDVTSLEALTALHVLSAKLPQQYNLYLDEIVDSWNVRE